MNCLGKLLAVLIAYLAAYALASPVQTPAPAPLMSATAATPPLLSGEQEAAATSSSSSSSSSSPPSSSSSRAAPPTTSAQTTATTATKRPPDLLLDAQGNFVQVTYTTCITWPGMATAHCGVHRPILDASMDESGSGASAGPARVIIVQTLLAVGVGLLVSRFVVAG